MCSGFRFYSVFMCIRVCICIRGGINIIAHIYMYYVGYSSHTCTTTTQTHT